MELQEKSLFAQEKLFYDAIPLIIFDKAEKENFKMYREDVKYYVSSPSWMKFRLLLFWTLWAALIMAIIITVFAHFWYASRMRYSTNIYEHINITVNTLSHEAPHNGTT